MYGRKDNSRSVLRKTGCITYKSTYNISDCKNTLTTKRPMTTFVTMNRNPRYLLAAGMLCFAFWWLIAWSCSGAPGGSPLPQASAGGQMEFCDPRASLSADRFFQALCLIQDHAGSKLILRSTAYNTLQPAFGNASLITRCGNCSPDIRSINRTDQYTQHAKYYLETAKSACVCGTHNACDYTQHELALT